MKLQIQILLKRMVIIFAITTILQLILGTALDNQGLYELLALAFLISLLQSFLFKKIIFEYSIPRQIIFLFLVWGLVIGFNYIFKWHYQVKYLFVLLGIVLVTYAAIRLLTYYHIKGEANEMNRLLKK